MFKKIIHRALITLLAIIFIFANIGLFPLASATEHCEIVTPPSDENSQNSLGDDSATYKETISSVPNENNDIRFPLQNELNTENTTENTFPIETSSSQNGPAVDTNSSIDNEDTTMSDSDLSEETTYPKESIIETSSTPIEDDLASGLTIEPGLVFLSGSGHDSNSGADINNPVATLGHAFELLNGAGGTIVICGNVTESTGLSLPAQTSKVTITGQYNGEDYATVLSFGNTQNQANKNLVFVTETEINHLTINYNLHSSITNKLLTIYSGDSLTIGANVSTRRTNESGSIDSNQTMIALRGGNNSNDTASTSLTVLSGTYRYILAGNNVGTVNSANINLGGTATVYDFVQCGGIEKAVSEITLSISGGYIETLYMDGYNHSSNTVNVTISGGSVKRIADRRSGCSSDILSTMTLTLQNDTVNFVESISLGSGYTGNKLLNLICTPSSGPEDLTYLNATLSQWNRVAIQGSGIVQLCTPYSAPTDELSISDLSSLLLTAESSMPNDLLGMSNVLLGHTVVFIDPINGTTSNSGKNPIYPVSTWDLAVAALNGNGGTLVVCNDTIIAPGSTSTSTIYTSIPSQIWDLKITGQFNGVNYDSSISLGAENNSSKIILGFLSSTTIDNIAICYNRASGENTSAEIWSGPCLKIGNSVSTHSTGTNNQITIRSGLYDSTCGSADLTVMSGSWNYIQGGNSRKNVANSTITFGGTAITQFIQGGGTNYAVTSSNVTISGGTIVNSLYANGYGTSAKPANMQTSVITITGGSIGAIYESRNTNSPIIGTVSINIVGSAMDGISSIDVSSNNMVSGTATLICNNTTNPIVNANLSQWDQVIVADNSTLTLWGAYVTPTAGITIDSGSIVYLSSVHNSILPTYNGSGTISLSSDITHTHSNYTESFFMSLDNQKQPDGTDVDKEQGMALWNDELFIFHNHGVCKVYDLETKASNPISTFNLGSYNSGTPSADYSNHCNTVMFGENYYTDPVTGITNNIPLLYVRTGNGSGKDSDGYYARLAVENIIRNESENNVVYSSQLLQTILYSDIYDGSKTVSDYNQEHGTNYVPASGFGAPMWLVDTSTNSIYILSAKYRTTFGSVGNTSTYPGYNSVSDNYYVITRFELPSLSEGAIVTLTPEDILDQFTTEFAAFATQGGTLYDDTIIYTFGFGQSKDLNPNAILTFDLTGKQITNKVELWDSLFASDEIEACVVWNNSLLVNTQGGYIYQLRKPQA